MISYRAQHPVQAVVRHHVNPEFERGEPQEDCRFSKLDLFSFYQHYGCQRNVLIPFSWVKRQYCLLVQSRSPQINVSQIIGKISIVKSFTGQPLVTIVYHSETNWWYFRAAWYYIGKLTSRIVEYSHLYYVIILPQHHKHEEETGREAHPIEYS